MSVHGEYKVPGGKLVVIDGELEGERLRRTVLSGDFFLEPDEALGALTDALQDLPVDIALDELTARLGDAAAGATMLGFAPRDIALTVLRALGRASSWFDHDFELIETGPLEPVMQMALEEVLGRQVDSMGLNLGPVSANRDKLRTLAMAGAARSPFRPDVPTLKELGFNIEMASERGLVAPAATPPAVLAKLREAMCEVVQDPDFVRIMRGRFTEPRYEEGSAWFTRLRGLQDNYRTLWQRTPWNQR